MVPRQPTTTIASSTSTPSRFSSKRTLRASLNVGIDVYAKTAAATGNSGGTANWAAAANGSDAVQIGR